MFAGWRIGQPEGLGGDGLPHAALEAAEGLSLFETIEQSGLDDERTYILERRSHTFAIMNVYPYTSGHVMVLPLRAVAAMDDLDETEFTQLWALVREATVAIKKAFSPQGLNIGLNEGTAGGGSHPDHLHVHIVPRWSADTNFLTSISNARVLPVTIAESRAKILRAWPGSQ